jgi:hypothetical protein
MPVKMRPFEQRAAEPTVLQDLGVSPLPTYGTTSWIDELREKKKTYIHALHLK